MPHWKDTFTEAAPPVEVRPPFKIAELDVKELAVAVFTEGGTEDVRKLTSSPNTAGLMPSQALALK